MKKFSIIKVTNKIWFFIGEPMTGKTTFVKILKEFGLKNIFSEDIGSFKYFEKIRIEEKNLNIFIFNNEIIAKECYDYINSEEFLYYEDNKYL